MLFARWQHLFNVAQPLHKYERIWFTQCRVMVWPRLWPSDAKKTIWIDSLTHFQVNSITLLWNRASSHSHKDIQTSLAIHCRYPPWCIRRCDPFIGLLALSGFPFVLFSVNFSLRFRAIDSSGFPSVFERPLILRPAVSDVAAVVVVCDQPLSINWLNTAHRSQHVFLSRLRFCRSNSLQFTAWVFDVTQLLGSTSFDVTPDSVS